ncbi:MAG TPA: nitrogenase-stabilizing/protective protein NifW [Anaeromyxobacter sp.]|nr:nitrogenase-stabilizing/protective protein NifW [Anaeromyxobacter sp.]
MNRPAPSELAGLSEAEEFFEALGVPFEPRVLDAHRLHVMKAFGLAIESWLATNPDADADARRRALAGALREAHAAFAEEEGPRACNPFAPGLVRLRRR